MEDNNCDTKNDISNSTILVTGKNFHINKLITHNKILKSNLY